MNENNGVMGNMTVKDLGKAAGMGAATAIGYFAVVGIIWGVGKIIDHVKNSNVEKGEKESKVNNEE